MGGGEGAFPIKTREMFLTGITRSHSLCILSSGEGDAADTTL